MRAERPRTWGERLRTPVARNAAYLVATEAVAGVLGFLFWAVAARAFSDADVGVGAVLISSGTLLAILSTLGFNISLVRFLPERGANVARMVNSSVTIGAAVSVALAVAFGLAAGTWLPAVSFLATNPALLVLFSFFTVVWTMSLLFDAAFIGLGKARFVFVRAVVYNALKVPLPLALGALFADPRGFLLFSSWGIGLLVANALAAVALLASVIPAYRLRPDLDRASVGSMLRYSVANHATNILGAMPGLVFPLVVAATLTAQHAGYFYVAWVLANILFIIPGSIFTSVFAEGSRWLPGLRAHALDGLYISIAALVPAVAAVILAGPSLLGFLRSTFLEAVPLLNVLAVSSFFVAINVLYITVLRVDKRMRPVVALYLGTTLGALGLGFVLMVPAGLVGAGIAFAVAQGSGAAFALRAMLKEGVLRRP